MTESKSHQSPDGVRELAPAMDCGGLPPHAIAWPHAPAHRLSETGIFMVTSGTHKKQKFFKDVPDLRMLQSALLEISNKHSWTLEAWAVFPNHYHFVAVAPEDATSLIRFLRELHSRTAIALNKFESTPGRKIWHNFWETKLSLQKPYFSRLNYVHQNAVKHGIVPVASQYPWCSASWFEREATPAQVKTIYSFNADKLDVLDGY